MRNRLSGNVLQLQRIADAQVKQNELLLGILKEQMEQHKLMIKLLDVDDDAEDSMMPPLKNLEM